MTTFRPKLWTGVSAAILLSALAACSEGGEGGEADEATQAAPAAVGEGGEGGAEGGAGIGEAGAQSAYAAVPAASRVALRLAHLKAFLLIAQKQKDGAEAASALIGQGIMEAYDAQPGAFQSADLQMIPVRKAAETGAPADIAAAIDSIEAAQAKAPGDAAAVVKGLVSITAGLYRGVVVEGGGVDAVEYQHALGAALAAQEVAAASSDARVKAAKPDIDALVALFPTPSAPAKPTPVGQLSAQASRIELALS